MATSMAPKEAPDMKAALAGLPPISRAALHARRPQRPRLSINCKSEAEEGSWLSLELQPDAPGPEHSQLLKFMLEYEVQ